MSTIGTEDDFATSRCMLKLLPVHITYPSHKNPRVEASAALVRGWQAASVLVVVVSMSVACGRTGSTGSPHQAPLVGVAPSSIQLDLLADGNPVIYWQYTVAPHEGQVHVASEAKFNRGKEEIPEAFDQPTGAIEACGKDPVSISPNGRYSARCRDEFERNGQFSVVHRDAFIVENRATGTEAFHWKMEEQRRIRGFSWSPDSSAAAVLSLRHDYVRFAFLGHMAVPHDSVYLDVIGVDHQFAEFLVRRDVAYAWTRILKWTVP